jgi:hypothetical protein
MIKSDIRFPDLLASTESSLLRAPAWFAAAPAVEETGVWDWLAPRSEGAMEVSEFDVSPNFIEALFGVRPAGQGCAALAA